MWLHHTNTVFFHLQLEIYNRTLFPHLHQLLVSNKSQSSFETRLLSLSHNNLAAKTRIRH